MPQKLIRQALNETLLQEPLANLALISLSPLAGRGSG